jgi:hypothetical protein
VIITIVESALPNSFLLNGKPANFGVPWVSLSVSLNVLVTTLICARLLRMRSITREVLSPELSRTYTSVAAMLIESAAPFTALGIGLVITEAQGGPLAIAFSYVWGMFCVECALPFLRLPQGALTFFLWRPTVALPTDDHFARRNGPRVAQGDRRSDKHGARLCGRSAAADRKK